MSVTKSLMTPHFLHAESLMIVSMLFWALIVFKLWLICRKCSKNGY